MPVERWSHSAEIARCSGGAGEAQRADRGLREGVRETGDVWCGVGAGVGRLASRAGQEYADTASELCEAPPGGEAQRKLLRGAGGVQSSEGLSRCPCSMVLPWPFSQAKLLFVVRIAGIIKMSPKPRRGPSTREADLNSCNHSLRLRRKVLQLLRLKQLHNGVFLKAWRLRPLAILLPRQAALR